MSKNIVVIGAGVVGLTTAYELLQSNPDYQITLLAKQIPTDFQFNSIYTSPFAGANWASFAADDEFEQQKLDAPGFYQFKKLAKIPETGVKDTLNVSYITKAGFERDGCIKKYPWFFKLKGLTSEKHEIGDQALPQDLGYIYGHSYDGVVITTTLYLAWLLNQNLKTGRFTIKRKTIKNLADAIDLHSNGKADIVINATGLLAKDLVEPEEAEKLYAIRGVLLLVENYLDHLYGVHDFNPDFPSEGCYLMPRGEGGTVIGGCFEIGNDDETTVSEEQKNRLISNVKKHFPRMFDSKGELTIVREQVGFRPGRKGGPRIELDQKWTSKYGIPLIHNYGHGGAGYQASWGSASKVLKIIEEFEEFKSKL